MKVGDRVRVLSTDYSTHNVGDEGTIKVKHWDDGRETAFGVVLDDRRNPIDIPTLLLAGIEKEDEDGWSYLSSELELA